MKASPGVECFPHWPKEVNNHVHVGGTHKDMDTGKCDSLDSISITMCYMIYLFIPY